MAKERMLVSQRFAAQAIQLPVPTQRTQRTQRTHALLTVGRRVKSTSVSIPMHVCAWRPDEVFAPRLLYVRPLRMNLIPADSIITPREGVSRQTDGTTGVRG